MLFFSRLGLKLHLIVPVLLVALCEFAQAGESKILT